MFREMRRLKQSMTEEECLSVLKNGTSGVLAVAGDDDYPYAVPLSYVYDEGKIFFHCAQTGHKLDGIARNAKVSFCVVGLDDVMPEKYTTYYRSVIVFGRARVLDDPWEKRSALEKRAARYSPDQVEGRAREVDRQLAQVCMVEVAIEHMTGKESMEFVRRKTGGSPQ